MNRLGAVNKIFLNDCFFQPQSSQTSPPCATTHKISPLALYNVCVYTARTRTQSVIVCIYTSAGSEKGYFVSSHCYNNIIYYFVHSKNIYIIRCT